MNGKKIAGSIFAALGWAALFFAVQMGVSLLCELGIMARLAVQSALDPALDYEARLYGDIQRAMLPMALLAYAVLLAALAVGYWGAGRSLWRECAFVRVPRRCFLWPMLTALLLYLGDNLALLVVPFPESMLAPLTDYSTDLTAGGSLLFVLCVVCATPVVEELIFRGLIYRALRPALPMGAAVLLSALIFGAAHFSGSWLLMLPAFLIGLLNAYTLEKTGSLLPCIGAHFAANLSSLLQAPFLYAPAGVQWAAVILCLTGSAVCAVMLVSSRAGTKQGGF